LGEKVDPEDSVKDRVQRQEENSKKKNWDNHWGKKRYKRGQLKGCSSPIPGGEGESLKKDRKSFQKRRLEKMLRTFDRRMIKEKLRGKAPVHKNSCTETQRTFVETTETLSVRGRDLEEIPTWQTRLDHEEAMGEEKDRFDKQNDLQVRRGDLQRFDRDRNDSISGRIAGTPVRPGDKGGLNEKRKTGGGVSERQSHLEKAK